MTWRQVVGVVVLAALGAALGVLLLRGPEPVASAPRALPVPASGTGVADVDASAVEVRDALTVLHAWDARRAEAYARGSGRRLRDLYVAGSSAAAADVRMLARYRARGLRVVGLRTQVLALGVVERDPDRWTLRVTDRVQAGTVVGAGSRLVLPRDAASTRVVTLVWGSDARWRVARVADAARRLSSGRPAAAR